jgi:hypothetical protein
VARTAHEATKARRSGEATAGHWRCRAEQGKQRGFIWFYFVASCEMKEPFSLIFRQDGPTPDWQGSILLRHHRIEP